MRDDIIDDAPTRDTPISGGLPGNPTEAKGIKLTTDRSLRQAERTVSAIDAAVRRMSQDQRILFAEKYQQGKPWRQICREQYWSERKYHRMRNGVVRLAAEYLGKTG
jgi:RinA family phage transcriptional activator